MKKEIFFLFIFLTIPFFVRPQDAAFSSFDFDLQNINPAYAGSSACGRAESGLRLQWPALSDRYLTMYNCYDQSFKFGGVGFNHVYDNYAKGFYVTDRYDLSYSFRFSLGKDSAGGSKFVIQPGFSIGYLTNRFDANKFFFPSQVDIHHWGIPFREPINTTTKTNIDFSAGLLAYTHSLSFGLAMYHLSEPDMGFMGPAPLPMRFVADVHYFGGHILTSQRGDIYFLPSLVYMRQGYSKSMTLNVLFEGVRNHIQLGIGGRLQNKNAMILLAGYHAEKFYLRYSYDVTTGDLKNRTGGAHEIHFGVFFATKKWDDNLSLHSFR